MEKIKKLWKTTGTKHGSYSVGLTALVIAIVVAANLILGQLPEKYRNIDVSSTRIYEISDTSRELLKNLKYKVKFTVLAEKESTDDRIKTFLSKYTGLSDHISAEWIDPVLHPSALNEYSASENTIVVECEETGKSTTVSFDDIVVVDMYSYMYTGTASESEFDGEGQFTSAVNYVTSDVKKNIYRTAGHGETTLSSTITGLMDKNNYTVSELNLLMSTSVPEDCDLLLMYAPTNDLTGDEAEAVRDYLAKGGSVMVLLGDTPVSETPNLSALMKEYGMEGTDGYIADMERNYQGNYYYLFPELSVSGELANGLSSQMVLVINTHGVNVTEPERDTISVNSFMNTSNNAYAVTEDSQEAGNFSLGATAVETVTVPDSESADDSSDSDSVDDNSVNSAEDSDSDGNAESDSTDSDLTETRESRFTVIAAGSLVDSQITDTFTQLENTTLFMNVVSSHFEDVQNISIEPKSLEVEFNTVQHGGLFSLLVIFGIPLVILISGFVVWYRRRKA